MTAKSVHQLGNAIRDKDGALKAIAVKKIEPTSVDIAKAEAARYGLVVARRLG